MQLGHLVRTAVVSSPVIPVISAGAAIRRRCCPSVLLPGGAPTHQCHCPPLLFVTVVWLFLPVLLLLLGRQGRQGQSTTLTDNNDTSDEIGNRSRLNLHCWTSIRFTRLVEVRTQGTGLDGNIADLP